MMAKTKVLFIPHKRLTLAAEDFGSGAWQCLWLLFLALWRGCFPVSSTYRGWGWGTLAEEKGCAGSAIHWHLYSLTRSPAALHGG